MFTFEAYLETLFFQKSDNRNEHCWQGKQRDMAACLLETANAWGDSAFNSIARKKSKGLYIYLVHMLRFIHKCITIWGKY